MRISTRTRRASHRTRGFARTQLSDVLLNRYCDGANSVAWHDGRDIPGRYCSVVASLTHRATRAFDIRPKADRTSVVSVDLDHSDLALMRRRAQSPFEIVALQANE